MHGWFSLAAVLAADAGVVLDDFERFPTGAAPPAWKCGTTGEGEGQWLVASVPDAPSGPKVLKQAGKAEFPWCVLPTCSVRDGFVEVWLRLVEGREDRAGGVVFRWKDARNYLLARANALEDNVALYAVIDGRRRSIKSIDVKVAPSAWHYLRVELAGPRVTVYFNRKRVLDAEVPGPAEAGPAGVWTKADSVTAFDAFRCGPG